MALDQQGATSLSSAATSRTWWRVIALVDPSADLAQVAAEQAHAWAQGFADIDHVARVVVDTSRRTAFRRALALVRTERERAVRPV